MGVFATRAVYRPSMLGLSVVKLLDIDDQKGVCLYIEGADFIDQTPIVDIKPYLPYSDCPPATSPMPAPHAHKVSINPYAYAKLNAKLSGHDIDTIQQLIAQDPRPAYKRHQTHTPFFMRYDTIDVRFFYDGTGFVIDEVIDVFS